MYSVVLATMLSAGASTPDWHHCHGCYSYCGCSCYCSCSCYGYAGYRHYSHHCHGWCGCYGGYGCHSYVSYCSCYCSSCYCSSCYCSSCYCSSCYCGGCYCSGCYGCGYAVYSTPTVIPIAQAVQQTPVAVASAATTNSNLTPQEAETLRALLQKSNGTNINRSPKNIQETAPKSATVTVLLPADARLWVDNVECPLTSSERTFNTPPLSTSQKYFYNVRMEVARNGKTVSETQRVVITPGEAARVDFNSMESLRTVSR
jgi:uncharacterized protein (TIGR03000 family)